MPLLAECIFSLYKNYLGNNPVMRPTFITLPNNLGSAKEGTYKSGTLSQEYDRK